ncbi:hypothetical protein A8O28_15510 [Enterobacteriaceae bacterium CCUG 67584]|nr:hypothetical protein [Enterobacteriaceae bacterium CCUG 67584]
MSGIAHYYVQQQSMNTQQVATLSAQTASSGASQTSVPASFQQVSHASQPIVSQPAIPTLNSADTRQTAVAATPASFGQLDQYARIQGWSEKQIALMNRLSEYKNSRSGPAWRAQAQVFAGFAITTPAIWKPVGHLAGWGRMALTGVSPPLPPPNTGYAPWGSTCSPTSDAGWIPSAKLSLAGRHRRIITIPPPISRMSARRSASRPPPGWM